MNKYNHLLLRISEQYGIGKGCVESEKAWKCRIIYSIAGQMGLASLWDMPDDGTVSIIHMKNRMTTTLESYRDLYPETLRLLPQELTCLSDEIYEIFLQTGVLYHRSDRVAMAVYSEALLNHLLLPRGYSPGSDGHLSGLGLYTEKPPAIQGGTVDDMYHLGKTALCAQWKEAIERASWIPFIEGAKTEYLRMKMPYTRGYWVDQPNRDGRSSILRTGQTRMDLYYLYRYCDGKIAVSPLQEWQVQNYQYRVLSCACLDANNTLPAIRYHLDGDIVNLVFDYLPPPAELNFVKLYSWPESLVSLPCDFKRVCTKEVFFGIQTTLAKQEYRFVEE